VTVHRSAKAFDHAADVYDRARPEYPLEAVDWLLERLEVRPGSTVLDLAAGTGKLTKALARARARVVAVEPSRGMLDRLRELLPGVEAHEGTAQAIPMPDSSADAVTVAQALHWFATEEALAEIHRVLRPGGRLGLVWNRRDLSAPAHAGLEAIFNHYESDTPRHRSGAWRDAMDATALFELADEHEIRSEQHLDADGLVDRAASISFIAALDPPERDRALADARALARSLDDPIVLPHVTELFAYSRRDRAPAIA
jgi:ubiquinone/menaquinone biosynthesis C-methylase UbiE